jgi:hypothetical protein
MRRPDAQLMAIFADALACDTPEARTAVVDQACGNDAELRAAIEALLAAHHEAGDFLKGGQSPIDFAAAARANRRRGLWIRVPGRAIGAGAPQSGLESHQAWYGHP